MSAQKTIEATTMSSSNCTNMTHSLLYFDAAGRAQAIRILLTIAGVSDFNDQRFPFPEWATKKPLTPLGSVPVLTIDGTEYVQSVALARYAARLAGWYPKDDDPLQALVVDQVMESLNEVISKAPRSGDPQEFYKLRVAYQENELTKYAAFLEGIIQRNNGVGFTTMQPTVADLYLHLFVQGVSKGMLDHVEMTFFETYPGIMATSQMIEQHADICAYYEKAHKK